MNYRDAIRNIGARHAKPGEDWDQNLLTGAPAVVDAAEALRIADWLDTRADAEWGDDQRYHDMATDIRAIVVRRGPGKGAQDLIVTLRADDIPTILCGLSRQEVREAAPERVARIQRTLEDALSSG